MNGEKTDLRGDNPVAGALCVLCAAFCFSVVSALVKSISEGLDTWMIVFFRNVFAFMFVLPVYLRRGLGDLRTKRPGLQLLRGLAGVTAMFCLFFSVARMPMAEAVLLTYTNPIFIALFSYFWLKETITARVKWAIGIGFAGIILILKPGTGLFQPIALVGLLSGVMAGLAMTTIRKMSDTETPVKIVMYYTGISFLVSGVPVAFSWKTPGPGGLGVLVLIGLIAVTGQLVMTKGYSLSPPAKAGPFIYGTVVFSCIIGWIFWGEVLDAWSIAGAVLVTLAGITATYKSKTAQVPPNAITGRE